MRPVRLAPCAAGARPTMRDPGVGVAEPGHRPAPVVLVAEGGALVVRHLLAPRHQPRARPARHHLGLQPGERIHGPPTIGWIGDAAEPTATPRTRPRGDRRRAPTGATPGPAQAARPDGRRAGPPRHHDDDGPRAARARPRPPPLRPGPRAGRTRRRAHRGDGGASPPPPSADASTVTSDANGDEPPKPARTRRGKAVRRAHRHRRCTPRRSSAPARPRRRSPPGSGSTS